MFSLERDPLAMNDMKLAHKFLPVGFYYKTLIKPRWLWPKVEPMIRKVAGLGKVDKSDLPRHLERVYRHPDVVVLGAGPAGLAAALGAAEAGASVIIADEGEHPGSRLGAGATRDAVHELLPQVEAHERIELLREPPRVRPLRGPRGAADRPRPARDDAAQGDRRRDRRVRVDGGLPRQRRARRDARPRRRAPATQHAIKPGNVAVVLAGTHEVPEHVAALQAAGTQVAAVILPDGATSAPGAAGRRAHDRGRDRAGARQEARQRRERPLHGRHREDRVRPALPLRQPHAAGEPAAPGHGDARARGRRPARPRARRRVGRPRARGRRAGGARRGRRAPRARPEGAALRRRRLRLHLRGRLGAGRAQRRDRGLLVDRAAQALHDDHDGPLPGPHVPRPDAHARRAPLARRRAAHLGDDDRPPAGAHGDARRGHRRRLRAPRAAHGAARRPPRPRRVVPVGRPVEARRQLRLDREGVPRGARGRRHHRRRHARQVPRLRARRRGVPRAALPEPRGRHPARAGCATACCSTSTA